MIGTIIPEPSLGMAGEIPVSHFSSDGLAGWETKTLKGKTEYQVITENERVVIKAVSHAAASGLIKKD